MPMSPSADRSFSYTNGSSRWATRSIRKIRGQNDVLGGVYSDGKPFGSTYDIAFDESGNTLALTSATGVAETGVYAPRFDNKRKSRSGRDEEFRTVPIRLMNTAGGIAPSGAMCGI